jgi:hypothetical protein
MESEKSLNLRERLGQMTVRCRHCRQLWLAPGLAKDDEYACRECGEAPYQGNPSIAPAPHDVRTC